MADFIKKPLGATVNQVAQRQALDAIQLTGKALPCHIVAVVSSGIVTVAFDVNSTPFTLPQVTVPIEYPEYIRYPIKVGDKGMVFPADARLGYTSGLGGGVPDLTQPSNLAALSFVWLGSTAWSTTDDANAVVVYGPNGVVLRNTAGTSKITISSTGIDIQTTGQITLNGIVWGTHVHSGVSGGPGDSGPPV